ncbi:uncharacterized protein LOC107491354 [Arachis duranensis]|uniref:Uncharacterized protein LOC107491354 n=1 Tax=Arachis duranensis TaxID=130453 RepID=A0A6P4DL23_ARADU|nr:uncharacterized protein LOC107491354 [Arachis duranensis]
MVAISLYRGNLHRVPDVPRRWLMPNPKISLKDFKTLVARRSKALSRLYGTTTTATATTTNPNPNSDTDPIVTVDNGPVEIQPEEPAKAATANNDDEGPSSKADEGDRKETEFAAGGGGGSPKKMAVDDGSDAFIDSKNVAPQPGDGGFPCTEKHTEPVTDNVHQLSEKEKRKKEVEDKLQVLNAKKHNLVLVLKQILNAEEELKRRSSMQAVGMRGPSAPLQVDGMNDTGSMTRLMAPRLGSEGNLVGDVEGGEADMHSRHMLRTSSMSPSSESPLRRTPTVQQNVVSHPTRATLAATGSSPSRFALSGHQGNQMNLPSVSVSGTYIASSPSPAASGGTSVFRDARQPSPWK